MIEIRIPKDIRGYAEKIFLGLTGRHMIAIAGTVCAGVGFYFLFKDTPLEQFTFALVLIPVAPLAVWGFMRPQGLPAEQYVKNVITSTFLFPERRSYKTENLYDDILWELNKDEEEALKETKKTKKKK